MHGTIPPAAAEAPFRLPRFGYLHCFWGIQKREILRFLLQRGRFLSTLVRPLVWLFIFAAGFRSVLGVSIIPPYETYVLYEVYVTPGLCAMILLFAGMQSSLSMVYDREVGSMRILLTSPYPRWYLLASKLVAGTTIAVVQVYAYLAIAYWWEVEPPPIGYLVALPAVFLSGLMLGSIGLFVSSLIKQLENFASVMNFIIFPMFFTSSALYPLWRVKESSLLLYYICTLNPFTYTVELIRFGLHAKIDAPQSWADFVAMFTAMGKANALDPFAGDHPAFIALLVVVTTTALFMGLAILAYDPSRGLIGRRGGPEGAAS
ncbi:ABC transporter permease [Prosthecomicrobium hirschii]|uniref:ABC transporter permease n=1 Tax=Prosthecodimorpha hirschii TaxID=665126 RepID=UPI000A66590A|nr:ABC transporter permease [Prosthecomicrobium hirschii]MCW1843270.1 ABC transporter permease [Prosthecomicrobium hirschii]TPQ49240.1 multidrug ABC transporter permease [Prosthecomicrobium hirschii]